MQFLRPEADWIVFVPLSRARERRPGVIRLLALQKSVRPSMVAFSAACLAAGLLAQFTGLALWSRWIWSAATVPVLLILIIQIVASLRRGDVGLDVIAAISMAAALVVGEHLAAAIVALMYAGGQYLENFAERRASREMTALLARVPRSALRHRHGKLEEVDLDVINPGDRLLIRQGDVVPVDGTVVEGLAVLDRSALTGESVPVKHVLNDEVISGATNAGAAFDMQASRHATESTYAGIVRLVAAAQRSRAPMSRLADRYAIVFLIATIALAGGAWLLSADPARAVAVLVVATPCPLILAVPVALISGLSRAAKHGILIKSGKALETLARVRSLVVDKTGTLTHGHAKLARTNTCSKVPADELLRLAASLDQASKHVVAQAIVEEAQTRGLELTVPSDVVESPGEGIEGIVEGHQIVVGSVSFVRRRIPLMATLVPDVETNPGTIVVAMAITGQPAGIFILRDTLRAGTEELLRNLRQLGIERIVLATGDRRDVAEMVAKGLSVDAVRSELTPDQKTLVVLSERKNGPVMMVGDGVNDAPALAAADLGLAMGARGAAASAEAADIVLLVDQLDRVLPAIAIARRSRLIALESVFAGIGLSVIGMVGAALGSITAVQGALLQEIIDVAVILNALRALHDPRTI
jgi:heavy metal translocating P-type ATPase